MKTSHGLLIAAAVALVGVTGCTTKNYVKSQTAPIIDHTNQLEQKTADNNRALHEVDDRATAGIKQAQNSADQASQNAQNATKAAGDADTRAGGGPRDGDHLAGQAHARGKPKTRRALSSAILRASSSGTSRSTSASFLRDAGKLLSLWG